MILLTRIYHFIFRPAIALLFLLLLVCFPQKASAVDSSFVTRQGSQLMLNGAPYRFTGINAYQLATLWKTNAGCGSQVTDLDVFFKSLRPNSMVRMWAFQGSIGTNVLTGQLDFTPLDRVINTAAKYDQKLVIALSGQSGTCDDGHWKDSAWYLGGYRQVFNDDGRNLARLSYFDYVKTVVGRYKNSPAVAIWEPVSEPESSDCVSGFKADTCYLRDFCENQETAAVALRSFFDTVGGEIKRIDPNHLIGSGVMGTGQCGTNDERYVHVHQSQFIDVGSYHDYGIDTQGMPGDQWNGLKQRIKQMKAMNKPIIVGEAGIEAAGNKTGCGNTTARRNYMKAKMDAGFKEGISGFLPWSWQASTGTNCTFDVLPGDPLMTLIRDYPLDNKVIAPTPTPTRQITIVPTNRPATPIPIPAASSLRKVGGLDMGGYCASLRLSPPTITTGNWKCGTTGANINMSSVCIWQLKNPAARAIQDISGNQYSWSCYVPAPTVTPTPRPATPTPTLTIRTTNKLGSIDISRYCATLNQPAATITNGNWKCGTSGPDINMSSVCIWQYKLQNTYAKMETSGNQYSWSCYR
jgi:mannan endo-1,4-beta-mannosidase